MSRQGALVCAALSVAAAAACAADAPRVEFALRWDAGGPMTAQEALRRLPLSGTPEASQYKVEYFDIGAPPALAADETAIGRRRTNAKSGKVELTYKTRIPASAAAAAWTCPLPGARPVKTEIDVTLLDAKPDAKQADKRMLSRSCELKSGSPIAFPQALRATPRGCTNTMKRLELGNVTVEEWDTPKGKLVEVSMRATDAAEGMQAFRKLVAPLLTSELHILDRSKTEAGSACN